MVVQLTGGVLNLGKHSAVTFIEPTQDTECTKICNSNSLGINILGYKDRKISGKIRIVRGSKKSNIALRGRGGHFKAPT